MKVFLIVWFGQVISLMGSGLTDFALVVWIYQQTHSATQYTLMAVCSALPVSLLSPLAGVIVDRFNRRTVMIFSDLLSGCSTAAIAILLSTGHLTIWPIYIAVIVSAIGRSFQLPAYMAAVPLLVSQKDLARANGLIQFGYACEKILTPILAGVLVVSIGLSKIILLDLVSFLGAISTLMGVKFPPTPRSTASSPQGTSIALEMAQAWRYLYQRQGLFALALYTTTSSFLLNLVSILFPALVLSFASASTLGTLLFVGGIGMLCGSLTISLKGGTQNGVNTLFSFIFLAGFCLFAMGLQTSVSLLATAMFLLYFSFPFIGSFTQLIIQRKVALDMQGRLFAFFEALPTFSTLLAYILSGPLADGIFEPLMVHKGLLSSSIGQIIGVGPGRGIALMFIIFGCLCMGVTAIAYQYSPLRQLEKHLPDILP